MTVERIVPNRFADDAAAGREFFTGVIGMKVAMELDFITTYRAAGAPHVQLSVISADPAGLQSDYSVGVSDAAAVHTRAQATGCEIVSPLTDEDWGVRRFSLRDPFGGLANIVQNRIAE